MSRIQPSKHKKFLYLFNVFLHALPLGEAGPTGHLGVSMVIRGKVSVTGNAKKRTVRLGVGPRSRSSKSLRVSFAQRQVNTPTGVLGLKCFIFY